jgi:hypothetical protein
MYVTGLAHCTLMTSAKRKSFQAKAKARMPAAAIAGTVSG